MAIHVAIHDKQQSWGHDGELFEFTDNDPDVLNLIKDWLNEPSFDYMEVWRTE